MNESVCVTIYSRENCPLCEEAKETVEAVADRVAADVRIEEVDVDAEPALREEYGERVPYVLVDERPAFKYRVDAAELERALDAAASS